MGKSRWILGLRDKNEMVISSKSRYQDENAQNMFDRPGTWYQFNN